MALLSALVLWVAASAPVGPVMPAATHQAFQQASIELQTALAAGELDQARTLLTMMPSRSIVIEWDDSELPEGMRPVAQRARDRAVAAWAERRVGLEIRVGTPGNIRFEFAPELPPNADSPGPAGAVYFANYAEAPQIEAVIARVRGERKVEITEREIFNEVLFGIGRYLGLAEIVGIGNVATRTEGRYPMDNKISPLNDAIVNAALEHVAALGELVAAGNPIEPAVPTASLDLKEFTTDPVMQGESVVFSVQVANNGNSPLRMAAVPDCSCVSVRAPTLIEPGTSGLVRIAIDTTEVPGNLEKNVFLYTGDPDLPEQRVNIHFRVEPRYRFLYPSGSAQVIVGDVPKQVELFLAVSPQAPIIVNDVQVSGMPVDYEIKAGTATLPDPLFEEPASLRVGYKIILTIPPTVPPGRVPITVSAVTADPQFPVIRASIFVQKGIVALPATLYFGEVPKQPSVAEVRIERPTQAFKITKVECTVPYLTGEVVELDGGEQYIVRVRFSGEADFGPMQGKVIVHTDDPRQPTIEVPVLGTVR